MLQVSFRCCLSFAPWLRLGSEARFHELQLISSLVTWSHKPLRPENQCSVPNLVPVLLSQWDSFVSLGLHSSWLVDPLCCLGSLHTQSMFLLNQSLNLCTFFPVVALGPGFGGIPWGWVVAAGVQNSLRCTSVLFQLFPSWLNTELVSWLLGNFLLRTDYSVSHSIGLKHHTFAYFQWAQRVKTLASLRGAEECHSVISISLLPRSLWEKALLHLGI